MSQPGPSSSGPMHFATYQYAFPNGGTPLSPLPKQLFMRPPDPYASHHYPSPHSFNYTPSSLHPAPAPHPTAPQSETSEKPEEHSTNPRPQAEWAIWSRRPQDPAHAPGIIISPHAKPPPHVVEQALELPTPPMTPITDIRTLEDEGFIYPPPEAPHMPETTQESEREPQLEQEAIVTVEPAITGAAAESEANLSSTVSSSSATEITDRDTPVVGSPVSSITSLSASIEISAKSTRVLPPVSISLPASTSASGPASPSRPTQEEVTSAPAPAAPAPLKKSWASLLQPSSSTTLTPGQKRLPTSSVVGISIPASAPVLSATSTTTQPPFAHPALSLPHAKRTELLALLTAPADASGAPTIHPRGLINAGNMCFANSVLQVLVYCPPFHRLFTELGRFGFGLRDGGKGPGPTPLVDAMVEFVREFSGTPKKAGGDGYAYSHGRGAANGKGKGRDETGSGEVDEESFLPSYVYDAMKEKTVFDGMRSGQQEDAEEFLGFFLDALEEELLAVVQALTGTAPAKKAKPKAKKSESGVEEKEVEEEKEDGWLEVGKRNRMVVTRTIKAAETPITRMFGGKVRSTLKAPGQKDSVTVEAWRALRLDIQPESIHTVTDALGHMAAPQTLELDQGRHASIQHLLDALPPVLVVHLKRFYYDKDIGGVTKIGKAVQWGEGLEVGGDAMSVPLRRAPPTRYKLFGALYHHGQSASGGHYTLDVLHPARNPIEGWMRIDDELVSDVRFDDVFAPQYEDENKAAYLLFYRKVG